MGKTLLLPTYMKSQLAIKLAYLHLILAHSKSQGQGHAYYDHEYQAARANIVIDNS